VVHAPVLIAGVVVIVVAVAAEQACHISHGLRLRSRSHCILISSRYSPGGSSCFASSGFAPLLPHVNEAPTLACRPSIQAGCAALLLGRSPQLRR
jgi:hypothetical protein